MRIKTFKKLHIEIPEIVDIMLDDIQNKKGFLSTAETARYCFSDVHKREFPDYIQAQKTRVIESKEDKAKRQVDAYEIREQVKKNKTLTAKTQICDSLNGKIVEENGNLYCKYEMFAEVPGKKVNSVKISEPLEMLTENSIELQYRDMIGNTGEKIKEKLLAL